MLPEETDHFEDVQTSSWRPIYHASRLLVHNGCGFTAARLLGEKKKKEKKKKKKEDEEEDPLLPAPGKCRGTNTLGEFAK